MVKTDVHNTTIHSTHLFDSPDNLKLGRCLEVVPLSSEQYLEISGDIPARHIYTLYRVRHGKSLVNGNCVSYPISGIQYNSSYTPSSVETEDCLHGHEEGWGIERLEKYLKLELYVIYLLCKKLYEMKPFFPPYDYDI